MASQIINSCSKAKKNAIKAAKSATTCNFLRMKFFALLYKTSFQMAVSLFFYEVVEFLTVYHFADIILHKRRKDGF